MLPLYNVNGLMFWSEQEINLRNMMEQRFVDCLKGVLKTENRGFEFFKVEAPLLTPTTEINPNYTKEDIFSLDDLTLRPETTMGSYAAARHLLNPHNDWKVKFPLVVYQHGKSFRREQDQVVKNMRLKEFYQLEFQILYGLTTANDYSVAVIPAVQKMISELIGPCEVVDSDRIPSYALWTRDIICKRNGMEVCSISARKDFDGAKCLEVAIGTDRCVHNFNQERV